MRTVVANSRAVIGRGPRGPGFGQQRGFAQVRGHPTRHDVGIGRAAVGCHGPVGRCVIEAQAAAESLPESLAEAQPWIRPLASIQSGIRDAEALRLGLDN